MGGKWITHGRNESGSWKNVFPKPSGHHSPLCAALSCASLLSLVQLMMDHSTPRSLSGIVARANYDGTLPHMPAHVHPVLGIALWTAFQAQQASSL
jgi:hypothetical protein